MREFSLPGRLILLPGVCMTPEVFASQRKAFGDDVVTPDWITPELGEPVGSYATRWAEAINATLGDDGRPVFLGGVSFGGTVALEMAAHLDPCPDAVLLIGAARHADGLATWAKALAGISAKMPAGALKKFALVAALPLGFLDGLDDTGIKLFTRMAKTTDARVLHWAVASVANWVAPETSGDGRDGPSILQIHGHDDRFYPLAKQDPGRVVEHGNHLIHLNHASTVNRWLFDHTMRLAGYDTADLPRVEDPRTTVGRRF